MPLFDTVRALAPYLQSWLEYQRDQARVPGVQVAVRVSGKLAASFALGVANEATGQRLTPRHLFRIASHSKTFTATAIFQLAETGTLRLDDLVGRWLPELAGSPPAGLTVRALLGHQSGINRDGADSDYWQQLHDFPDRDALVALCRADAVYPPNQFFKYSNMGYSLLGLIIEVASGQTYEDYVAAHITGPLALTNLGPELPQGRESELAAGHSGRLAGNDPRRVLPSSDTRAMAAATGFYGTAEDVTAYLAAHALGRVELLTDASRRLMQRKESEISRPVKRWYGLGFMVEEIGERTVVGHSGGFPGYITQSWLDPESGLAVSVLTNCLGGPATDWATNLIKLIDLAMSVPEKKTTDAPGSDLDTFTGRFATDWGVFDLVNLGGRLVSLTPQGDPALSATEWTVVDAETLIPEPEAGFGAVGEPLRLQRTAAGDIEWVRQGGGRAWPIAAYRQRVGLGPLP
ncbi:serine hydrolase domain-containing protein [Deinococcus peraridilitoris]|uniref:Penicillin-binding protein, beta-lactamase class C n=1 Tax=Deinococcus peraridilitoris (strain DSM 19664 / LMG 22246 / CIP 109416 / KR-200) TaxID=937777 RepID=L0A8Z9_DEIPD|nr:serine hydrolase domain-containing protein [Deinococcus peraridilitoris]AFZ69540.1 penicillin-binding protein, beta-lactamase class C [Deinococcus peraridilitoris DSM 19664]